MKSAIYALIGALCAGVWCPVASADAFLRILHGEGEAGVELHCVGEAPAFRSCGASRIAAGGADEVSVAPVLAGKVFGNLARKIPLKAPHCSRSALSYSLEWKATKRAGRACNEEQITAALYSAESRIGEFLQK